MSTKSRLARCTSMAASGRRNSMKVLCFCLIFLGQPSLFSAKYFPTLSQVQTWSDSCKRDLVQMLDTLTGHPILENAYNNDNKNPRNITFYPVNETAFVDNMSSRLSAMLSKKMDALWALVRAAEDAAKKYVYIEKPAKGDVSYYNAKSMFDVDLVYDKRFKQEVNFSFSSVHIPVEIYDGDEDILNGLNWTSQLDEQFKKNLENDRTILWQYFGSQTGFMRTYPASRWETYGDVDLFDVRRQSWYTQGSSSPKDMMILIDTSGSTHGQALQLMKNAVKSILDTLGENDFVNIVRFALDADYVSACFNHTPFVQANYRNKKQLERDVDNLEAMNQADYKIGLRFAFQKFKEFSANQSNSDSNIGANCNKVILLLTDGATDNAEEVFREHNWPNKSVRVFTYAVGPTATPVAAIKWMACANRGYFSHIPAMGAIRARVQDFLEVLGRPLAVAFIENIQWTSTHRTPLNSDTSEYTQLLKQGMESLGAQPVSWEITVQPMEYIPVLSRPQVLKNAKVFEWGNIYRDHLGLGMMTTVTLPVYNRTEGSSNQTILGVMGIDVTTAQLEKYTPHLQIGPTGYSFAINPNGYAVFHPNLKRSQGRYMKDPPNIDLLELEVEGERPGLLELRNQMIEGDKGIITVNDTLFLSPDKRYVSLASASYAFTNITNTTFRLGLCVPLSHRFYPKFNNMSIPDFKEYQNESFKPKSAFLIAPWEYLGEKSLDFALNNTLDGLISVLQSGNIKSTDLASDNIQLLQHLAWDVAIAMDLDRYFGDIFHHNFSNSSGESDMYYRYERTDKVSLFCESPTPPALLVSFKCFHVAHTKLVGFLCFSEPTAALSVQGISGLRATFVATNGGLTMVYPASEAALMEGDLDVSNASYYTRAVYARDSYILMADSSSESSGNDSSIPTVVVARSVSVKNYTVAVVGVRLDGRVIVDSMLKSIRNASKLLQRDPLTCDDVDDIQCYLLDDGGFLVASNQENHLSQLGTFMGEVDPQLWRFFENNSVYGSVTQYDFQAVCPVEQNVDSAGHRTHFVPSIDILYETLSVSWWTSKISWAYVNFNIYQWLFGSSDVHANSSGEDTEEEDCVTAVHQYYLQPSFSSLSGNITCFNCTREVRLVRMQPKTKLVFVVTGKSCDGCPEMNAPIRQGPQRISREEEENIVCNLSMHPRKRVQSYGCYDHDPNEDDTKCGAGAIPYSGLLILVTSVATATTVWVLSQESR